MSDVPGLGATSQHAGLPPDNSLGTQPPQIFPGLVAAQMEQFVEQRGPARGNHERLGQWSGAITWWGTDTTRNETRELRARVTATASKGDPYAIFLNDFPLVKDLQYIRAPAQIGVNVVRRLVTCTYRASSVNG